MIPTQIDVGHYRALRGITVPLDAYTALVGPNGVGKSTVLEALDFFLSPARTADQDDFQNGCTEPVSVTLTLSELNDEERTVYADFIDDSGRLVVSKVVKPDQGPQYEVLGLRHCGFDELREIARTGKKTDFTNAFKVLVAEGKYDDLTVQRAADDSLAELVRWEKAHPDRCEEGPVPFAFHGSTKDQLIPTTRFVYVPAVQDASDTLGGTQSPLQQMLNALVYPRFEADEGFIRLKEHVAEEYQRLFPAEGTPELIGLAKRISDALETFCPGTAVMLGWDEPRTNLKIPPVLPAVVEDGIATEVERKGHGLQRALIIAMLQAEDEHRRTTNADSGNVHVILMIEEPELYQHPTQCRHFRKVLANLASTDEGSSIRVLVTTHSPDFISLDGINAIRILRRETVKKGVPPRKISSVSLEQIATRYAEVTQKAVDEQQLFRQLHVVDSIMREAFFANAAVLLEGVGDHGLLAAQCAVEGIDIEGKGIVLIPCGGKSNMPLSLSILRLLGIKHYAVFDSDRDPGQNGPVMRALGVADKDIPKIGTPETGVYNTYAVLKPNVEAVVSGAVGKNIFEEVTAQVGDEYGRTPEQTLKNPATAERVLAILRDKGLVCERLREIASKISAL